MKKGFVHVLILIIIVVVIVALGYLFWKIGFTNYQTHRSSDSLSLSNKYINTLPSNKSKPPTTKEIGEKIYINTKYHYTVTYPNNLTPKMSGTIGWPAGTTTENCQVIEIEDNTTSTQNFSLPPQMSFTVFDQGYGFSEGTYSSPLDLIKKNLAGQNKFASSPIKVIEEIHEISFANKNAYEYKMFGSGFSNSWTSFYGQGGNIIIRTFEHDGNIFLIGFYDTSVFNQIISTFKFTE